jgi:hypothetical protein
MQGKINSLYWRDKICVCVLISIYTPLPRNRNGIAIEAVIQHTYTLQFLGSSSWDNERDRLWNCCGKIIATISPKVILKDLKTALYFIKWMGG